MWRRKKGEKEKEREIQTLKEDIKGINKKLERLSKIDNALSELTSDPKIQSAIKERAGELGLKEKVPRNLPQ